MADRFSLFSDKNRHQWARNALKTETIEALRFYISPKFLQVINSPINTFFVALISFLLATALRKFQVWLLAAIPEPVLCPLNVGTACLKHYLARPRRAAEKLLGGSSACKQKLTSHQECPAPEGSGSQTWLHKRLVVVQALNHTNHSRIPRGGSRHQYFFKTLNTITNAQPRLRNGCCKVLPNE